MCHACDAPDVLAEALQRTNELGLALSINRVHEALMAWGAMLELHKIEQAGGAGEIWGGGSTWRGADCGDQPVELSR